MLTQKLYGFQIRNAQPVIAYSPDGREYRFPSIMAACRAIGHPQWQPAISHAIAKNEDASFPKHKIGGLIWMRDNDSWYRNNAWK